MSGRAQGIPTGKHVNWTKPNATVSGADGVVDLKLTPPVEHRCTLFHPGYLTADVNVDDKKYKLGDMRVIDLGDIKLATGNSVKGTLKDKDGKPVYDAWVAIKPCDERSGAQKTKARAMASVVSSMRKQGVAPEEIRKIEAEFGPRPPALKIGLTRTTRTAADGSFELRGLDAMKWHIAAWNGSMPAIVQVVDFSDSKADEPSTKSINFAPSGESITVIARLGDQPLADAQVRISLNSDPPNLNNISDTVLLWGKTDSLGRLAVSGLPPNSTFRVMVTGRGAYWSSGVTLSGATETAQFDDAVVRIKLKSDSGEPIKAAKFQLVCRDSGAQSREHYSRGVHFAAESYRFLKGDSDTLEYFDVCLGSYTLEVAPTGHAAKKIDFKVTGKLYEETLEFATGNGSVKGTLVDAISGKVLSGIKVTVTNERIGVLARPDSREYLNSNATTKDDGTFLITGLAYTGRTRSMVIDVPAYRRYDETWEPHTPAEALGDVKLFRAGALHGTVVSGNAPVAGKRVELWLVHGGDVSGVGKEHSDLRYDMNTGPDGKFQWTRIDPGDYAVRVGKTVKAVEINGGKDEDAGNVSVDDK